MWACLQHYGLDRLSAYITDNCKLAAYMGDCVRAQESSSGLRLAHPVVSNVCVFLLPESCPIDANTMASILQSKSEVREGVFRFPTSDLSYYLSHLLLSTSHLPRVSKQRSPFISSLVLHITSHLQGGFQHHAC